MVVRGLPSRHEAGCCCSEGPEAPSGRQLVPERVSHTQAAHRRSPPAFGRRGSPGNACDWEHRLVAFPLSFCTAAYRGVGVASSRVWELLFCSCPPLLQRKGAPRALVITTNTDSALATRLCPILPNCQG